MSTGDLPTVVIVDDAAEVRTLVKTLLRVSGRLSVVGEADNGSDAVALAARHHPDLMLLDVSMPGMDGLEALPLVLGRSPQTRVVMFSGFAEQGLAQRTLELGATAFLEKGTSLDTLADDLLGLMPGHAQSPAPAEPDRAHDWPRSGSAVVAEHLERFRELFDEAAIGMATLTLTGRIVRVNRAFAALVGREEPALIGTPYAELSGGRDRAVDDALHNLRGEGVDLVPIEHDVTGTTPPRRVVSTLTPVRDSAHRPLYLFVQLQDLTATRAAQHELQRSEERFRLLVSSVHDHAIFMLDPDGVVMSWNAGAQKIKGYAEHEIVGRHFRTFYPPHLQEARHPEHELELALRDGHYEEEGWRIRKDGSRFWANVVITPVYDETGTLVGFGKVTRDQTARREADERLRLSEERFRLLVSAVQDYAIFMLHPDGRIASWNAGAERSQGYLPEEIIGQHFRVFYPPQLQESRHPEHELELALRDGHYEEEGWRIRKDGTRFWASVTITAVHNDAGEHLGFAKVTRDLSERRELLQRLQAAVDDQAQFLAVTAHELRSPVAVLGGSADTLHKHGDKLAPEDRDELLTGMVTSATRLRRLLADLLTASRLQASALELHPGPTRVAELLEASAATARRTFPDAAVTVEAPADLVVHTDRDRLAQVVDNLVANGLRHGASPVHVRAWAAEGVLTIRVADSGQGVSEEMRERLFQRFATGVSRGGTGLGLFIVRELARRLDGDATYEPAPHGGPAGSFVLTLPAGS